MTVSRGGSIDSRQIGLYRFALFRMPDLPQLHDHQIGEQCHREEGQTSLVPELQRPSPDSDCPKHWQRLPAAQRVLHVKDSLVVEH
jgi:hypothetical protein